MSIGDKEVYPFKPPCDCGNRNAYWDGDKYGLRTYRCISCHNYHKSGAANPWRGLGKDLRFINQLDKEAK